MYEHQFYSYFRFFLTFVIQLILHSFSFCESLQFYVFSFIFLQEIVARIKDGRLKLVVTTELAARGIDIPELSHVINFELPTDAPHYVHRYSTV